MPIAQFKQEIIEINRKPALDPWFSRRLEELIFSGEYHRHTITLRDGIINELINYRTTNNISTVVAGISGGVDSALTAALFKSAGWAVQGMVLPIHQDPDETDRGEETCKALGIPFTKVDLTIMYESIIDPYRLGDATILEDSHKARIRRGNIRARLRMMTLYNQASALGGLVASTDNLSELAAGFWTIHGDEGDLCPIQSLTKSWEVPALALLMGVPHSVVNALPTDGLGITNGGDEAQLGVSYLEFDIALLTMMKYPPSMWPELGTPAGDKFATVKSRIANSRFKRARPVMIAHPIDNLRFNELARLDKRLLF